MSKRSFEELRGPPESDHNGLLAIQDLLSPDEREPTPPSGPSGSKKPRNFIATVVRNPRYLGIPDRNEEPEPS
jgi:hypothetical protein